MKLKQLLVGAFLLVASAASAQMGMQMPPIPIDQNVKIGKLDNGLTYYIRHNEWPEHVANFYIAQRVGSIQEEDSQRGLAHFLEHMAFNGSEHFPDSTLLEYTRSLGVEFGSDLNAYTSIDQTVYRICDVPTARQTALDSCLLILKDWSNGLTLSKKEIDQERGVIHQEWQLSSTPTMRIFERILPKLYPGSKYGERLPIGLMSVVDGFKYDELRNYYHKWYRPDNQAIIVVGDIDVEHTEALIKQLWADSKVPADAAQVVDVAVPDNAQAIYLYDKDKEMTNPYVSIAMKHEATPDAEKVGIDYLMGNYFKRLFSMMFNQRLSEFSQKADCPFMGAEAEDGTYIYSKTKDAFQMQAAAKEGQELATLATLYREAQRVRQYGFTAGEYDRCKAEYMSQLESAYTNRNKTKNHTFGQEYTNHYLANEPIPGIETEYQLMSQITSIPYLNVDALNEYAKELITDNDSNFVVYIMGQEKAGDITTEQMAQTIASVRSEQIEAYVDNAKNEPLIDETKLPKAGKIVKETENKELGYKELTLSNGARVILKKTDFKENEIQFQAMAKGGKRLYGQKDYANTKLFDVAVGASGLSNFSNNELEKALYGKQVTVQMGLSGTMATLGGTSVPKDIETLLQLVYLNFTAISKDNESYNSTMAQLTTQLKNKYLTPEGVFSDSLHYTLRGHDERTDPVQVSDVEKANYDRIIEIAREQFNSPGQFVYYFIGNFDEATLRPLIEKYIACLPKGKAKKQIYMPSYLKGEHVNTFTNKSETPKAIAFDFWHAPIAYTAENKVLTDAAGQILSMIYLKNIREDASAAYSVGAYGAQMRDLDTAHNDAVLQVYCPMDPNKSDLAVSLIASGMKDAIANIDADKVQKVKDYMLKNYAEQLKTNNYWMDVIDEYIWTGVNIDHGYKAAIEALTPAQISNYLKTLTAAGNHVEVVMTPAK